MSRRHAFNPHQDATVIPGHLHSDRSTPSLPKRFVYNQSNRTSAATRLRNSRFQGVGIPASQPGPSALGPIKKGNPMDSTRASRQAGAEERDEAGYDERARRVLNLFFVLNASRSPISTNDIIYDSDLGYNSGNPESDKRKFLRDRNDLARYGIHIVERKESGASEREESSWAIDRSKTDASLTLLTADDADILLAALGEYAEQPHIPYRPALERIQAKLMGAAGSADSRRVLAPHIDGQSDDPVLQALWSAFTLRRQAMFSYKNAQGDVTKKRSVSIWGFFTQDDLVYFVGFDLGRDAVRTFRVDRVTRVYKPSTSYLIPEDFNITDYQFLPFDLSNNRSVEATFTFPVGVPMAEIDAITHNRGTRSVSANGTTSWQVTARDLDAAASFALGHASVGMKPGSPAELIESWNEQIAKAVKAHVRP